MKKIISLIVAVCICFTFTLTSYSFGFSFMSEKNVIEARESDWPEYNYGNWKEIAEHPEDHAKVLECIGYTLAKLGYSISAKTAVSQIYSGLGLYIFGASGLYHLTKCLIYD